MEKTNSSYALLTERGICVFLVWLCGCEVICVLFWEHKQDLNYGLSKFQNPLYSNVNASFPLSSANHSIPELAYSQLQSAKPADSKNPL